MNFKELKSAIKFVQKTCKCVECKKQYLQDNIHVIAANNKESLMELKCPKCKVSVIVSVTSGLESELELQEHPSTKAISQNDILDIKIFLTKFDGNFKKLFNTKK